MSRKISFWFFVGVVVLTGIFFFQIVRPFLFPLLIAAVLALLFRPMYRQLVVVLRGHRRIAGAVAAALVVLAVVLPVAVGGLLAAQELIGLANSFVDDLPRREPSALERQIAQLRGRLTDEQFQVLSEKVQAGQSPTAALPLPMDTVAGRDIRQLQQDYDQQALARVFAEHSEPTPIPWLRRLTRALEPYIPPEEMGRLRESSMNFFGAAMSQIYEKTSALVANAIQFVIGFAVMALALYYFFAEGPALLRNVQTLIPLENPDEEAVWEQFERVCRGVVLGTILAAFVQAVLLGAALAVVGIERVWLLTGLTVLCSLIPFVGAAGVYLPVSIYLAWQGSYGLAVGLTAYGALVVSTSDNLVRAYVIHGSSRMHPLAALVSVLGALSLVGLWGVFVGPIVAGIFYSMLTILQQKFRRLEEARQPAPEETNTIKSVHDIHQIMPTGKGAGS